MLAGDSLKMHSGKSMDLHTPRLTEQSHIVNYLKQVADGWEPCVSDAEYVCVGAE